MAFRYDPKDAANTLPKGIYDASILRVTQTKDDGSVMKSRSGEAMQRVTFEVYPNDESRPRQLQVYFTEKSTLFRYRGLAHALGKAQDFTDKKFDAADHIGANLRLELDVRDDPTYGEQNDVAKFHPMSGSAPARKQTADAAKVPASSGISSDDIPF